MTDPAQQQAELMLALLAAVTLGGALFLLTQAMAPDMTWLSFTLAGLIILCMINPPDQRTPPQF